MTPEEERVFRSVKRALSEVSPRKTFQGLVDHAMCGHCHHAALAMQILLGGAPKGYKLGTAIDEKDIQHYWLISPSGEIIDPTQEQYTELGRRLPYTRSTGARCSYRRSRQVNEVLNLVS
jgi:hypothetical protein